MQALLSLNYLNAETQKLAWLIQTVLRNLEHWPLLETEIRRAEASPTEIYAGIALAVENTPELFPKFGVVQGQAGSDVYVKIADANRYIERISALLQRIESLDSSRWQMLSTNCRAGPYRIQPPPDPTGTHITLGQNSAHLLGRTVRFKIDELISYNSDSCGYQSSGWRQNFFTCRWFVLRVSGPELLPYDHDLPHISVAVLAFLSD